MKPEPLTQADMTAVQEYLAALKALGDNEPAMFLECGPDEEPEATPTPEWEAWNKKCVKLNEQYHDAITKALLFSMKNAKGKPDTASGVRIEDILKALSDLTTFSTIRQGTATNALTKIKATIGGNTAIDSITGEGTIKQGPITVTLPKFESLGGLKTSTYKLLDALTVAFTESGAKSPTVTISLDEYMRKCGLKDKKEARKQAKADLETLRVAAVSFTENVKKGEPKGYYKMNISGGAGISRSGIITFTYSADFFSLMLGYPIMPYPQQLWTLNSKRNPNSYYLLRKIAEHKNMNAGKKNEDIISVKTLLAAAPFIPSFAAVMKSDRHIDTRIIAPFERDMDALEQTLTWEYCHKNNTPLKENELDSKQMPFSIFQTLLVHITWRYYPDQNARLEKKAAALEVKGGVTHRRKGGNAPQKGG